MTHPDSERDAEQVGGDYLRKQGVMVELITQLEQLERPASA